MRHRPAQPGTTTRNRWQRDYQLHIVTRNKMYIQFPSRSEFLEPVHSGLMAMESDLRNGRLIEIQLKRGGYVGSWTIVLRREDQVGFDVEGHMTDQGRFPQRIRVAAWALHRGGVLWPILSFP